LDELSLQTLYGEWFSSGIKMRHRIIGKKLGRDTNQRKARLKGLANSVILYEKVTTTEAKAKAARPYIEKLITVAKEDNLTARRKLIAKLGLQNSVNKLFEVVGPAFKDRPGGYLRLTKLGPRAGDSARMVVIEFVEDVSAKKPKVSKKVEKKEKKPKDKVSKTKKTKEKPAKKVKDEKPAKKTGK
jgi:large subunit ribosomal protein L17